MATGRVKSHNISTKALGKPVKSGRPQQPMAHGNHEEETALGSAEAEVGKVQGGRFQFNFKRLIIPQWKGSRGHMACQD